MNMLNTALTTIRRSPYQALLSIMMVSVTFYVGYTFSLFLLTANTVLQHFETRPQIIAFFDLDTPSSAVKSLEQEMRQKPYVRDVTVVTKDQALEIYKNEHKDKPILLELVTADILPASIEVSGTDLESLSLIRADLNKAEGVEDVVYQEDIVEALHSWTRSLRLIGAGSLVVLSTISFLIITVLIAMKVASKKTSITIMRVIGATKWYIEAPFMLEGIVYGLVGSGVGWLAMYISLLYITPWLTEFLGDVSLLPIPLEFFGLQLAIGTAVGLALSGLAGFLAVRRLIRY
jgi:cell division transport system permease protein